MIRVDEFNKARKEFFGGFSLNSLSLTFLQKPSTSNYYMSKKRYFKYDI
jgi:hypothetical protein